MSTRLHRIRHPEYTGENRCVPCTVVNVLIAVVGAAAIGLASVPLGVAAFVAAGCVIYLRGYLVPGTPTLTQTYFPDRVLRWFDKDPAHLGPRVDPGDELDAEAALRDVGVLEDRAGANDPVLSPSFRDAWHGAMADLDEDGARRRLAATLGIDPDRISTLRRSRSFQVTVDDTSASWESPAAFVADVAADNVLADRVANWTDLPIEQRSGLTRSLRVYLEQCPDCGGPVRLSEESVRSCCRSRAVYASRCRDCGVRLFEIRASAVEQTT